MAEAAVADGVTATAASFAAAAAAAAAATAAATADDINRQRSLNEPTNSLWRRHIVMNLR